MPTPSSDLRKTLLSTIAALDERTRSDRAERVVWLSDHEGLPSAIMGRAETLHLLHEARAVFIDGHYAATLILALAVIEHSLVEELQRRSLVTSSPTLSQALATAELNNVLPTQWFAPIKLLSLRRNPFAHLKAAGHEHGLGARIRQEKTHPKLLLEQDAKDSVRWMYQVFRATLHELT